MLTQKNVFLKFFLSLFIYFERASRGGAEREGVSENPKRALVPTAEGPVWG